MTRSRSLLVCACAVLLAASFAAAQVPPSAPVPATAPPAPAPAPAVTPPPAPSPVQSMRSKLSAGDLESAVDILEVHRAQHGEDGKHLLGLSWLARGAMLVGDTARARVLAADVRARCAERLAAGADLTKDSDLELALGAAIEVEAQWLERVRSRRAACDLLRAELARWPGPSAFRSRLHKRLDLMTLPGSAAPELVVEDRIGDPVPSLASLRGRPVLLFLWAEWCGDCKAQAATLARVRDRHAADGLAVIAITRYYGDDRAAEKARVDSVWTAVYSGLGPIPRAFSTASMERYGGSATPTYVFIDRKGIVRDYSPTRLSDAALESRLAAVLR